MKASEKRPAARVGGGAEGPQQRARVAVVGCPDYSPGPLRQAVESGMDLLGGIGTLAEPGQKVLIKPNLFAAVSPNSALTTHPNLVRVLCSMIREAGGRAFVGDNPVFGFKRLTYARTGMRQAVKGTGAELVALNRTRRQPVANGRRAQTFLLPENLADFDRIVSVPKLKTHQLMGMTGAVKNSYGLLHGKGERKKLHLLHPDPADFARMLLDLNDLVRPHLHVADAVLGSDGNGPRFGKPKKLGCIVLGTDALAVDFVLARIARLPLDRVWTLQVAMQEEGWDDPDVNLEILGEPPDALHGDAFELPRKQGGFVSLLPGPVRKALIDLSRRSGR